MQSLYLRAFPKFSRRARYQHEYHQLNEFHEFPLLFRVLWACARFLILFGQLYGPVDSKGRLIPTAFVPEIVVPAIVFWQIPDSIIVPVSEAGHVQGSQRDRLYITNATN